MNKLTKDSIADTTTIPFHKNVEKNTGSSCLQKLLLPFYDRKRTVSVDEIIRLEGAGNYTKFFLIDGTKMLVSRTLKEYESLLDSQAFVRVHKSCIVNLGFVRRFFIKKEGELELMDGQQVKISPSASPSVRGSHSEFSAVGSDSEPIGEGFTEKQQIPIIVHYVVIRNRLSTFTQIIR